MVDGSFAVDFDAERRVLAVSGEIDDDVADRLRDEIESRAAADAPPLVVDLSRVTYLPSVAVGVLATALTRGARSERTVELLAAPGTIAGRVLTVCALPFRTST